MSRNSIESDSKDRARRSRVLGWVTSLLNALNNGTPDSTLNTSPLGPNFMSFYTRVFTVFRDPAQLVPIFLDLCSLLHSLWEEGRSGPNFIAPMSSLAKRPSGRLSRLLLQHSKDQLQYESEGTSILQENNSQTVAVIHLNKIPQESIPADLHGLMALLVFVETLILFLLPSWPNRAFAVIATLLVGAYATISGDGTLTLVRRSKDIQESSTSDSDSRATGTSISDPDSCAVLLGEDLTVVVKGPEEVVEAITNGGFHLSRPFADLLHRPAWIVARDAALGGFFEGLLYSMALLLLRWLGLFDLTQALAIFLALPLMIPSSKRVVPELPRMVARLIPFAGFLLVCMYTSAGGYVPRLGDLVQLAILLNLLPFVLLTIILTVPSQNYPLQAAKFLDFLGNPLIKKWQFKTPAAAAAFQCLVICDGLARPTDINVRGVLDTIILDQRDVWVAWKSRVADRIAHEEDTSFAPTLPTFRDEARQMQLKEYLDEAQYAYNAYQKYRQAYRSESSVVAPQHPTT